MSWLTLLATPISKMVSGATDIFKVKQERKKLAEQAVAKLNQSTQDGKQEVTITDAEWEAINASKQDSTWKDEYITIVITSPLVMMIAGAVLYVFYEDIRLLEAATAALEAIGSAGIDMGFLMEATVLAGLGLKIWRKS
jgi:hypothetical protein|tara:strand:- start:13443 stop:13859 length:417 start_codon:yes stop_codon:yes gene_type:complete